MKTSLKKITFAVLPLVAFLLIAPSSALAKRKHKHHDYDSYSRYYDDDSYSRYDDDDDCRHGRNRYNNHYGRNRDYGYYDDRYYDNGYYGRPSRSRSPRYDDSYYGSPYGNPYGNPSSYYPPSSTGVLPWLDILLPRY
jgi:hypothetical protein